MDKFAYQKALHGQPAFKGHAAARVVLQVIIDHADGQSLDRAWPSRRTIARAACVSTSTVHESIAYLVDQGFLVVDERGSGKRSTRYRLALPGSPGDSLSEPVGAEGGSVSESRGSASGSLTDSPNGASGSLSESGWLAERVTGGSLSEPDQVLTKSIASPAREEDADGAPRRAPTTDAMPRCANTPAPDWAPDNWHQLTKWEQVRLTEQRHRETAA